MEIKWTKDEDGFQTGEFTDLSNSPCKIQEELDSTLGFHVVLSFCDESGFFAQEHCAAIWPLLKRYAETGILKDSS